MITYKQIWLINILCLYISFSYAVSGGGMGGFFLGADLAGNSMAVSETGSMVQAGSLDHTYYAHATSSHNIPALKRELKALREHRRTYKKRLKNLQKKKNIPVQDQKQIDQLSLYIHNASKDIDLIKKHIAYNEKKETSN